MRRILGFFAVIFVLVCFILIQLLPYAPYDYSAHDWEEISLTGTVLAKESRPNGLVLVIRPNSGEEFFGQLEETPDHSREHLSIGKILCHLVPDTPVPKIGSAVIVSGKLKSFERATNPGQFDSLGYYQILKTDFRLLMAEVVAESERHSRYREAMYQLRVLFGNTLDRFFGEQDSGVLRTMLLGERGNIDPELKSLFQRNGIVHILAISGLHISLIGMGLYRVLRRLGIPVYVAVPLAVFIMYSYGVMTNMGASSFRAIVMFGLSMLAKMIGRSYDLLTALSIAAVLLLVDQPLLLRHSGFLFSFLAVLAIGVLLPALSCRDEDEKLKPVSSRRFLAARRNRRNYRWNALRWLLEAVISRLTEKLPRLRSAVRSGFSILVLTFPVYGLFYYEFPLYSLLLNLMVLPLMGVMLVCGLTVALAGLFLAPLAQMAAAVASLILRFYETLCLHAERLPLSTVTVGRPTGLQIMFFAVLIVIAIIISRKIKPVFRYLLCLLAIFCLIAKGGSDLSITFLDLGQGDAIFIATADRRFFFIDGGSSDVGDAGKHRVLPFLKSQGVRKIEAWFITHPHDDHYSAFVEMLEEYEKWNIEIGALVLPDIDEGCRGAEYQMLVEKAASARVQVYYIARGDALSLDKEGETVLTCLHPQAGAGMAAGEENEISIVLHLSHGDFSLLLTGDIEGAGERELESHMRAEGVGAGLSILKVAHHGSRFSTGEDFLDYMDPSYAVIMAGRRNSYGHPHDELLERLNAIGAHIYQTPENGAVTVYTDGIGMRIEGFLR